MDNVPSNSPIDTKTIEIMPNNASAVPVDLDATAPLAHTGTAEPSFAHAEQTISHMERVFPPFDFSFAFSHIFWLLFFFGLFYLFISRVIAPRIGNIIETRRTRIAVDFDHALRLKREAEETIALYEKELTQARLRADSIIEETIQNLKEKAQQERSAHEAMLNEKRVQIEENIAALRQKSMQNIEDMAQEAAQEIVQKVLGAPLSQSSIASALKNIGKTGQ